jgi:hypothetical protein
MDGVESKALTTAIVVTKGGKILNVESVQLKRDKGRNRWRHVRYKCANNISVLARQVVLFAYPPGHFLTVTF